MVAQKDEPLVLTTVFQMAVAMADMWVVLLVASRVGWKASGMAVYSVEK